MLYTLKKLLKLLFQPLSFNCLTHKKIKFRSGIKVSLLIITLMTVIVSCSPDNDELDAVKDDKKDNVSQQISCTELQTENITKPLKTLPVLTTIPEKLMEEQSSKPFMTKMPEYAPEADIQEEETLPPQTEPVNAPQAEEAAPSQESKYDSAGTHVYVADSGNGKKYHRDPTCSNMDGVIELTVDEAQAQGYTPCKKCY